MDPVVGTLITLGVTSLLNLILQINSTIKKRHCSSECCQGSNCVYDSEAQPPPPLDPNAPQHVIQKP